MCFRIRNEIPSLGEEANTLPESWETVPLEFIQGKNNRIDEV